MARYIARRLLLMVLVIVGMSVITFALSRLVPGNPARLLAGPHARPLDECQLLVTATTPEVWAEIVARARPLAARAGER